ncbi:MAG: hypothetical protein ACYC91_02370 [Solirubrobacteraceae bacterium]
MSWPPLPGLARLDKAEVTGSSPVSPTPVAAGNSASSGHRGFLECVLGGVRGPGDLTRKRTGELGAAIPASAAAAGVIRETIKRMQEAEAVFETAVGTSDNAPPDPGFPRRNRAVAEASLRRAEALSQASLIPGFRWTSVSDPDPVIRWHELRPGGNRPGPPHKCRSHDMAVERLSIAVQGNVISLVADEFREIGWVLSEIAEDLEASATKHEEPIGCRRSA